MLTSVVLEQLLLPQAEVSLGRFVMNIYKPHLDYHDPTLDSSTYATYKLQSQFSITRQAVDQRAFAFKLMSLLSSSLSKRAEASIQISSDQIRTYSLINTEKWFRDAIKSEATRKWIESTIKNGGEIYLVTGYHTLLDARIMEQASEHRDSRVKHLLPVAEALAPSAGVTPIFDITEISGERIEGKQREFTAKGELVYGMQYRKVRHRWFSRIDFEKMKLAKEIRWVSHDHLRYLRSDGDDTIEVELDEETKDGEARHKITSDTGEVAEVMPDDYPDVAGRFNKQGANLLSPYKRTSNMKDLEIEIHIARQQLQVTPDDHQDLAAYLNNLGNKLEGRYGYTGSINDLEEAIRISRHAVQITPGEHTNIAGRLNNLGNKLEIRYERIGNMDDLKEAIQISRKAVQITPDDSRDFAACLNNLGNKLGRLYERTGSIDDLEEAILTARQAVQITSDNYQDLSAYLNNLGNKLGRLYERTRNVEDLEESIRTARQAVQITPDDYHNIAGRLNNLGNKLGRRYELTGDMEDLEEAIQISRQAVNISLDDLNIAGRLNNLGNKLGRRYERTGDMEDLEEAILISQQIVDIVPDNHPNRAAYLNNLANKLESRSKRRGNREDLDEAIRILEQAADITRDIHPKYIACLNNIGNKLESRYEYTRASSDLERAIEISQMVVKVTPENHPDRAAYLYNFGNKLGRRYECTGDMEDLEEAIRISQQAMQVTVDDQSNISGSLNNVASKLGRQDDRIGEMNELSKIGSMATPASTYWNQEQWDIAEELNFQVMETHREKLKVHHPDTLASVSILASVLVNQWRYVGARLLKRKLLEMRNSAGNSQLGAFSRNPKYIPRSVVLVDTLYYLKAAMGISDAPVRPGVVRLRWKCPCGRRFHEDIPQKWADLSTFKVIIQDAINSIEERSLWSVFRPYAGTTSIRKAQSAAREQIRKIAVHNGEHHNREGSDATRGAEQSISGAEVNSSQLSTPKSTSKTVNDPEGVRRRVITSEVERDRTEDESDATEKWILIALPKDKFKTVEHVDMIEAQNDVQLFREIRKRYEARRQLRQRFLELHDVHKVHLVKFHLRQIPEESGKILDVASKTEKYEPPDRFTDLNWEVAAQDVGLESLPEFLMLLWHRARQEECKDTRSRCLQWPWSRSKADSESQLPSLPTHEQHMSDRRKTRWQDHALSIRIFRKGSNHRVLAWFRSCKNSQSPPQELTETPGIEIELSSDSFYVNYEVPRRIRQQLCSIKNKPVSGWGLWIEEEFIIPWYAFVIFNCIPIFSAVVGVYFSTKYGLGWLAVGGYGVAVSSFVFTQWIGKAKDSKR